MTWCQCSCGHHRSHHPYVGYGAYGTRSGYAGCNLCIVCGKPFREHLFVSHQFTRCECAEYTETCDSVLAKWKRSCTLPQGHEGRHRECEVSWTDEMAKEKA